jgi:hypothetical protein
MANAKLMICVVTATLGAITPAQTQAPRAGDAVPVAVENLRGQIAEFIPMAFLRPLPEASAVHF